MATWRSGQATSFGRYQLNSRTDTKRSPSVAGSRKSSAAANIHGVFWNCACAEKKLPGTKEIRDALATLRALAKASTIPLSFDLAELRGYHYHSGVVFDAYCDGVAGPVARGGRYDEVGKAFGRPRAATGFSIELRELTSAIPTRKK